MNVTRHTKDQAMTTKSLERNDAKWKTVWDALKQATGSSSDQCPETGEVWQYMGTYEGQHQFRHRHRPKDAQLIIGFTERYYDRVYLNLDAETLKVTKLSCTKYLPQPPRTNQEDEINAKTNA